MALTSLANPTSLVSSIKDIHNDLHRSYSSRDLCNRARIKGRFSSADNHVCYCINRIHATLTEPEREKSPFMGSSSFHSQGYINPNLLRSYSFDPDSSEHMNTEENELNEVESSQEISEGKELKRTSWLKSLFELGRKMNILQQKAVSFTDNYPDEEWRSRSYDRDLFSRYLVRVPWSDAKLFSQLAFLCNLAYIVPEIKATDLKAYHGLQFITSSSKIKSKFDQKSNPLTAAFRIRMFSAEDYVRAISQYQQKVARENSCTNGGSSSKNNKSEKYENITKKLTLMFAAGDEENQGATKDIKSLQSLPCEWFVCDDPTTYTRHFVIQGIHSLGSWQTYFLFEPIEFEGTNVLVHRGIYELAKKFYHHFAPKIIDHLARHGEQARLQFTGHCLGGSLSVIVYLMLLTRKVVEPSTLLPVVTFGSAYVFCGGQKIFEQQGLNELDHIRCVMLPRDIFPRSFSSNYPNHVTAFLKLLHGPFESLPCLTKKKMLYSPMGKLYIIQPGEMSSPPHPLLPLRGDLYALESTKNGFPSRVLRAFLNSPHPLETLSDPRAYGSEGKIGRDHDSSNYLRALNGVLRLYTRSTVRNARKQSNK
ncbi:phospholipase A1 PLIP1, chloroplastic-like [Argentina anserina]|uniref:phospholipase A1 PLIP1, chloroplastic-like n=1 Tax=Argentina anserina TaxID=57926 RepID=UPI00217639D9|nr:phospholipase A1 PLIP1, chloroplastic-like [Potentilla anserina]